ncbi:hypothetical protein [Corynebacterium sp. AOP12-C2-36]|uniref:hypothetical protein n=1 Tax=Corynebacterium sp. AOP12-C2-36 TaxID=3457723 RepID=UPI0040345D9C
MFTPPQSSALDAADGSQLDPFSFGFVGAHGNLSWSQAEQPPQDAALVCGGYLFADPAARFRVMAALHRAPSQVGLPGDYVYRFTDDRAAPADLAAAMLVSGDGSGDLTADGWSVLHSSPGLRARQVR